MTQARIAEGLGHGEIARNLFSEAHLAVTAVISKNPDDPTNRRVLASLNVTLDRPEEAINEAGTALQLSEQTGNFFVISPAQVSLAAVYARLGRSDDAFAILDRLASTPSGFFIWADSLKSDSDWDRIRSDPRFEKTVAAFTPE
jgi:predicted Zn-dependent protease